MSVKKCVAIVTGHQEEEQQVRARRRASEMARRSDRRLARSVLDELVKFDRFEPDELETLGRFQSFKVRNKRLMQALSSAYNPIAHSYRISLGEEVLPVRNFSEINGYGKLTLQKVRDWLAWLTSSGIRRVIIRVSNSGQIKKLRYYLELLGLVPQGDRSIPGHVLISVA